MSHQHKPRSGQDRRKKEQGPPEGWKERRRNPERRMPEVEEISIAEFKRLLAESGQQTEKPAEEHSAAWDEIRKL